MKTSLSRSQKPHKLTLQPSKVCKTFEHFQLGFSRTYQNSRKQLYPTILPNPMSRRRLECLLFKFNLEIGQKVAFGFLVSAFSVKSLPEASTSIGFELEYHILNWICNEGVPPFGPMINEDFQDLWRVECHTKPSFGKVEERRNCFKFAKSVLRTYECLFLGYSPLNVVFLKMKFFQLFPQNCDFWCFEKG